MDLYAINAAHSLQTYEAHRVMKELEHLRVAREREEENAGTGTQTPVVKRRRAFYFAAIFRGRTRPTGDCA